VKPRSETEAVAERYARRAATGLYDPARPEVRHMLDERERALRRRFARLGWHDLDERRVLEVGCGAGGNLQRLLQMGFRAEHLAGVELLPGRFELARAALPAPVRLIQGDACELDWPAHSVDAVLVATVFSSLLDEAFQRRLATALWRWVRPGGGVLWYDFTVDNPRNPDVRGVPLRRIAALFPEGRLAHERVTLAPPLARLACRIHPGAYGVLNALPWLRTHVLAWVEKPDNRGLASTPAGRPTASDAGRSSP
jgi:SAM-dependent methyltransferase